MYLKRLKEVIREHRPSLCKYKQTSHYIPTSQRLPQILVKVLLCLLFQFPILSLLCFFKPIKGFPLRSPDKYGDAANVFRLGSKRWRDWCLSFGQRHADVCGFQGPAVIGSIPTHPHPVAATMQEELENVFRLNRNQFRYAIKFRFKILHFDSLFQCGDESRREHPSLFYQDSLQFLQLLHQMSFLVRGHACKHSRP